MGGYITPAFEAGMEISSFIEEQGRLMLGDVPPLSHYTSHDKMFAILESNCLRAGSLHHVNDMAEIRFSASVFRAVLDKVYSEAADSSFSEALNYMRTRMNTPLDIANVYSISFSSNGDDNRMWNLYADRGTGFSFTLSPYQLSHWSSTWKYNGSFWKCQYGEQILSQFSHTLLLKAKELFYRLNKVETPSTPEEFSSEYLDAISHFSAAFKTENWAHECEYRQIYIRPPHREEPYLELSLQSPDNPNHIGIDSIRVGPNCDESIVKKLQDDLSKRGHTNLLEKIIYSDN